MVRSTVRFLPFTITKHHLLFNITIAILYGHKKTCLRKNSGVNTIRLWLKAKKITKLAVKITADILNISSSYTGGYNKV